MEAIYSPFSHFPDSFWLGMQEQEFDSLLETIDKEADEHARDLAAAKRAAEI